MSYFEYISSIDATELVTPINYLTGCPASSLRPKLSDDVHFTNLFCLEFMRVDKKWLLFCCLPTFRSFILSFAVLLQHVLLLNFNKIVTVVSLENG